MSYHFAAGAAMQAEARASRKPQPRMDQDAFDAMFAETESSIIAAEAGAVPPAFDEGGTLPFGGQRGGGTLGPSSFGVRKLTQDMNDGPRGVMLNLPPEPSEANIKCWERNYKSHLYEDPSEEVAEERKMTTTWRQFGKPVAGASGHVSYLAEKNLGYGDLRQTNFTYPTGLPFEPPERDNAALYEAGDFNWKWPQRKARPPPPKLARPAKHFQSFVEEYDARPPWLKW